MSQPISIYTTDGVRLDVLPEATIEVNMGGTSLLDLKERTTAYTNSFDLPRTPTNESVFGYASQPTRNNRPDIDVIITKGLFQKKARLKVVSYENKYKCSISYDEDALLSQLKQTTIADVLNGYVLATNKTIDSFLSSASQLSTSEFYNLHGIGTYNIPSIESGTVNDDTHTIAVKLSRFEQIIESYFGITISGTCLSELSYISGFLGLPDLKVNLIFNHIDGGITYYDYQIYTESTLLISDVLKEIALFFFSELKVGKASIIFDKFDFTAEPIPLEGFSFTKQMYSGLDYINRINYDTAKNIVDKNSLGDYFLSTGTADKEVLKIKSYLPAGDGNYYLLDSDPDIFDKFFICTSINDGTKTLTLGSESKAIASSKAMAFFNLSGYYSTQLTPVFENAVMLDAVKWLDPYTANQIMTTRIIKSVQLGGRYWVDSMAYNLVTGQSKLTLIKL